MKVFDVSLIKAANQPLLSVFDCIPGNMQDNEIWMTEQVEKFLQKTSPDTLNVYTTDKQDIPYSVLKTACEKHKINCKRYIYDGMQWVLAEYYKREPLTAVERQQKYRERLKETDIEKYKEQNRKQNSKLHNRDMKHYNEYQKAYQKAYRAKKKAEREAKKEAM